jgi:hypothetical protein
LGRHCGASAVCDHVHVLPRWIAIVVTGLVCLSACGADVPTDTATPPEGVTVDRIDPTTRAAAEPTSTPGGDHKTGAATSPAPSPSAAPSPTVRANPTAEPTRSELSPATPSPTTPPPPEPTTGVAAGQPCVAGLAGDATLTSDERADVDGDGAADQITAYRVGEGAGASWHLRVDTAAGESLDSPLELESAANTNVQPLGGADIDGDGTTEEIFTVIGSGASVLIVGIHQRVGCELVQITIAGAPVGFPIGGGLANIGGLQCVDTDNDGVNNSIVAWIGLADFDAADGTYRMEGVEYQLRGTELRQVGSRRLTANVAEADFVYGQLTCGTVAL